MSRVEPNHGCGKGGFRLTQTVVEIARAESESRTARIPPTIEAAEPIVLRLEQMREHGHVLRGRSFAHHKRGVTQFHGDSSIPRFGTEANWRKTGACWALR